MRTWPVAAVVCSALAAVMCGGCGGGGDTAASPESARACLEAGGSDVISPPLDRQDELAFGLATSDPEKVAFAGLPAGGVAALGFYEKEESASAAEAVLEGVATLGGSEPTKSEVSGSTLVLWRRDASAGDRELLLSCLASGGGESGGGDTDPANPLGCVRVFLTGRATLDQKQSIEQKLLGQPSTREVRFVSKQEALAAFRKSHPELTKNLHGNPLPDSFEAGPARGAEAPGIADAVRGAPGVERVSLSSVPCSLSPESSS